MDPYKVLGIERTATDDEVKAAYRGLVKKYHPDKYQNNPLEDLAEEKVREINEAYDLIQAERKGGGSATGAYSTSRGKGASPQAMDIRRDIDAGRLADAEGKLRGMSQNAEWYFLSGMISVRKGWYEEGMADLQRAVAMDPGNSEYRQHLNSVAGRGGNYRQQAYGGGYRSNDDMMCKLCQAYICLDCCCNCI